MTAETITLRSALAVGFTDSATGARVRDGLDVTARVGRRETTLVRSVDGAGWSLHLARGRAPAQVGLRVADRDRRFLPLRADLAPGGELAELEVATAPTRPVPAGYAELRATMVDRAARTPLPGARLEVTLDGRTVAGHADRAGEVLVLLPWPRTPAAAAAATPPSARTWTVTARAFVPRDPPPAGEDFTLTAGAAYDARRIARRPSGSAALPAQTLHAGRPLVLKSEGDAHALLIV